MKQPIKAEVHLCFPDHVRVLFRKWPFAADSRQARSSYLFPIEPKEGQLLYLKYAEGADSFAAQLTSLSFKTMSLNPNSILNTLGLIANLQLCVPAQFEDGDQEKVRAFVRALCEAGWK